MNIQLHNDKIHWIVDERVADYAKHTRHTVVTSNPELVWCDSFRHVHEIERLKCKKVLSVHHMEPQKIPNMKHLFNAIDNHVDLCIVPNDFTYKQLRQLIKKPITKIPYWLLSSRMAASRTKVVEELRKKYTRPGEILIGSFQKDSDGDSDKPKFSKGPDLFLRIMIKLGRDYNIRVVLGGFSRKYLTSNFDKLGIKYTYLKMYENVNDLYDLCDWYIVTSRFEGGPQAIMEASYRKVNILSTKVGLAPDILDPDCLCSSTEEFVEKFGNRLDRLDANYKNVVEGNLASKIIPKIDETLEKV